ncbi:MAG TPA: hypothetical protein VM432_10945 [Bdellovibrionales bacterium]|nr:hypothetical protein [Bdellovibrionales bacterium]
MLLLFLEVGVLLTNLDASSLTTRAAHSQKEIGVMVTKKNVVQRRGAHTLIWDEAQSSDTLYEYDSVLTLSGSSALLSLGDTRLDLDQDTLVVLEPSSEVQGGFKIRFAKGSSRTRNATKSIEVITDTLQMTAAPGSSVMLSSLEDGRLHLDVEKGSVDVENSNGKTTFESGEKLLLRDGVVEERKKKTDDFHWSSAIPRRIYVNRLPATVPVDWEGDAKELKVLAPQKSVQSKTAAGNKSTNVELGSGRSLLWLEDGNRVSETLEIEVFVNPSIRIFNPRMRDRVRTGDEVVFAWQPVEQIAKYRVEVSRRSDFQEIETTMDTEAPRTQQVFRNAGTFYWRIKPFDEIGTELPTTVPGVFSVVPVNLEAPQLNPTEIREPATEDEEPKPERGAQLWFKYFVPEARAESAAMALFSWKPVVDAEYYLIEISATPDFAEPLVTEKVTEPKYKWRAARERKYFWRVAAGRGEELGPFSPADTISVKAAPKPRKLIEEKKAVAETLPAEPVVEPLSDEKPPAAVAQVPETEEESVKEEPSFGERMKRQHLRVGLVPKYRQSRTQNEKETIGTFAGFIPLSMMAEIYLPSEKSGRVELAGSFEQVTWKPKGEFTRQNDVTELRYQLMASYRPRVSSWSLGVGAESLPILKRKDGEAAELESRLLYGLSTRYSTGLGVGNFDVGLDLRLGSAINGGRALLSWTVPFGGETRNRYSIGPQAAYENFEGSGQSLKSTTLGFYLGIGW